MKAYEFILTFSLKNPDEDPSRYEAALEENDCTDALLGIGRKGLISLDFSRESVSAYEAISSAIRAVEKSIPDAELIEMEPDFVGITDIAQLVNRSRQNIRKLVYADDSNCPDPIHGGNPALWHLCDILQWLRQEKAYEIDDEVIDVATSAKSINAMRAWSQIEPAARQQVEALINIYEKPQPVLA
ncbi:MAG: DNA-binding protein [Cyanobacteria bacterium J06621_11]